MIKTTVLSILIINFIFVGLITFLHLSGFLQIDRFAGWLLTEVFLMLSSFYLYRSPDQNWFGGKLDSNHIVSEQIGLIISLLALFPALLFSFYASMLLF